MADIKVIDFDKFKKKPVEIKAARLTDEAWHNIRRYCEGCTLLVRGYKVEALLDDSGKYFTIDTLEGKMKAKLGDMLIIGVQDEIYACDKDIFDKTYDKVVL